MTRLWQVLWLALTALILRVVAAIIAEYADYFPPDFNSDFLFGRKEYFWGTYGIAFYLHIVVSPLSILFALLLLSTRIRSRFPALHRRVGWMQFLVVAATCLSGIVMATRAESGIVAGLAFACLAICTFSVVFAGVCAARRQDFDAHRCWMLRCVVLLCSAITLRLLSGVVIASAIPSAWTYPLFAWISWIVPLFALEFYLRRITFDQQEH